MKFSIGGDWRRSKACTLTAGLQVGIGGTWSYSPYVPTNYTFDLGGGAKAGIGGTWSDDWEAPFWGYEVSYAVNTGDTLAFNTLSGTALQVTYPDAGTINVSVHVTDGTLTLGGSSLVDPHHYTESAPFATVFGHLDVLIYHPPGGAEVDTLFISVDDGVHAPDAHSLEIVVSSPPPPPPPPPPTAYLLDHFNDTNGTLVTAHTMDVGPGWTLHTGYVSGQIDSNAYHQYVAGAGGGSYCGILSDAGHSDGTLTVKVTPQTGSNYWGIFARSDATGANKYFAEFSGGNLTLYLYSPGLSTLSSVSTGALVASTTYTVTYTCAGNTHTINISGGAINVTLGPITNAALNTNTRFGLMLYEGFGDVVFDDFQVAP